ADQLSLLFENLNLVFDIDIGLFPEEKRRNICRACICGSLVLSDMNKKQKGRSLENRSRKAKESIKKLKVLLRKEVNNKEKMERIQEGQLEERQRSSLSMIVLILDY
ncbi:ATP-dependent helicase/nuclease subunit A, partial [Bienertia sinuspersici]